MLVKLHQWNRFISPKDYYSVTCKYFFASNQLCSKQQYKEHGCWKCACATKEAVVHRPSTVGWNKMVCLFSSKFNLSTYSGKLRNIYLFIFRYIIQIIYISVFVQLKVIYSSIFYLFDIRSRKTERYTHRKGKQLL